ncbi:MAG: VacJ family lipoprotein [Desulfotalea sp.]
MKNCILIFCLTFWATISFAETNVNEQIDDDLFSDYDNVEKGQLSVADPLYYFNKGIYYFNDTFYTYMLNPVSTGYAKVVPRPARQGVRNFFYNLGFPIRFVNNLLQFKFVAVAEETGIFTFNTIYGLGFFKGAQKEFGLENSDEDFGQTLGSYSIGEGFYLVLPFFGPSNLRDTIGIAGDTFITPFTYVDPAWLGPAVSAQTTVNNTSLSLGAYEAIKNAAVDPYTAMKDGYIRIRRLKVIE